MDEAAKAGSVSPDIKAVRAGSAGSDIKAVRAGSVSLDIKAALAGYPCGAQAEYLRGGNYCNRGKYYKQRHIEGKNISSFAASMV